MTTDSLTIPTLIILIQREHARINNQIKRLQTYALDVEDLLSYRTNWQQKLGFKHHTVMLIQSVDHLIDTLEQGEYDQSLYDEVIFQLSIYKKTCWAVVERQHGSLNQYMDQRKQVKTQYKKQFSLRYEAFTKLPVDDQVQLMQSILSRHNVSYSFNQPDKTIELLKMIGVLRDDQPAVAARSFRGGSNEERIELEQNKVIDFVLYKQRKQS